MNSFKHHSHSATVSPSPAAFSPGQSRRQPALRTLIAGLTVLLLSGALEAQEEPDIRSLLNLVNTGNEQLLQKKLPQLVEQHPTHPGILYLQGILATDGDQAVSFYQAILAEAPTSEWVDDALYKLYEYYYAIGAYNVASRQAAELKKRFPASSYLKQVNESVSSEKISSIEKISATTFGYSLQAGAFSTSSAAQVRLRDMKALGYSTELRTKMKEGKKFYAVWIGEFNSFDAAMNFAKKMKQRHNIEAVVVRR